MIKRVHRVSHFNVYREDIWIHLLPNETFLFFLRPPVSLAVHGVISYLFQDPFDSWHFRETKGPLKDVKIHRKILQKTDKMAIGWLPGSEVGHATSDSDSFSHHTYVVSWLTVTLKADLESAPCSVSTKTGNKSLTLAESLTALTNAERLVEKTARLAEKTALSH